MRSKLDIEVYRHNSLYQMFCIHNIKILTLYIQYFEGKCITITIPYFGFCAFSYWEFWEYLKKKLHFNNSSLMQGFKFEVLNLVDVTI